MSWTELYKARGNYLIINHVFLEVNSLSAIGKLL